MSARPESPFRQNPRTGWVSAAQAASPQLATELARLSEENAKLRAELSNLAGQDRAALEMDRAVTRLGQPLKTDFERPSKKFGGAYTEVLANERLSENLEMTSIFDLILGATTDYAEGESQDSIERWMARRLGANVAQEEQISYVTNTVLLLMRTARLIEGYDVMRGQKVVKMIRLSDFGRRAFDLAFSRFVNNE